MVKFDGTLLTGMLIGAAFVTTGGAVAGFGMAAGEQAKYAEVVEVTPVTRSVRVPREVCVEISTKRGVPQAGEAKRDATSGATQRTRQKCRTIDEDVPRVVAYDVRYRLGDTVESVRLPQAPGTRVLVKDGRVQLEAATPAAANGAAPASG